MRRALILAPFALCSAACAAPPAVPIPRMPAATWVEQPPPALPPVVAAVSPRVDAMARWQLPVGVPWASYEKLTLLASIGVARRASALPDVTHTADVAAARAAAACVASAGMPADTMWIVDLRGPASVAFGATLSQRAEVPVANVLTFNNWPADAELVPAEETLAALVSMSPRLPAAAAVGARPVFLLDSWRLAFPDVEPDDDVTDNRYFLAPSDLPDVATLTEMGIHRVMYVVGRLAGRSHEEDDLNQVFLDYQRANIALFIVDVHGLCNAAASEEDVDHYPQKRLLFVQTRETLLEDPEFYHRSRGGFGVGVGWPAGGGNLAGDEGFGGGGFSPSGGGG